jgi:ParB-like chromosome segregation protein Spo0J
MTPETEAYIAELIGALQPLAALDLAERVEALNALRSTLHEVSPFRSEPVDFVRWVPRDAVYGNDYNPNSVAPPEMELLRTSIRADGYTQPIVAMPDEAGQHQVIDGFHRHRVGKECADVAERVHGYLPLVDIRTDRADKGDRIAATIRHNRARGKHKVEAMSDIVIELKRRNWTDAKISRELGMDADEVLRLCQITGLAEAFKDQGFSEAWEAAKDRDGGEELLSDVISDYAPDDGDRVLHTWDKWECYRHGFYAERYEAGTQEEGEELYRSFLADSARFEAALQVVTSEWRFSCEHYLTNDRMNRIAWLGQAAVAQALGVPSLCRGGYHRLTDAQQQSADALALKYLNEWLNVSGRESVTMEAANGRTKAELY